MTQYSGRLTCGPTKLTGIEGFVNLVNMNDSSSSDRTMSIQRRASSISALPAPAAQTSAIGTAYSLLPVAGCAAAQASLPHRTPIAGLAIPLLTHTCCYSPGTAGELVNPRSPPCGKQLPSLPWLRVVPFLGLAVVHRLVLSARPGQRGQ